MKPGDMVRHKLSGYMMGVIIRVHPTYIVLWDDGRCGRCMPGYLLPVESKS